MVFNKLFKIYTLIDCHSVFDLNSTEDFFFHELTNAQQTFNANFPTLCHHQLLLIPHYLKRFCMEPRSTSKPAVTEPPVGDVSEKANKERELVSWWDEPLRSGLLQCEHHLIKSRKMEG